jgi:hypothetical protein
MSDLTFLGKRKFEQFLGMASGWVLDFSNRTFADFVLDSTGLNIYGERYNFGSGSKANRLRAFRQKPNNAVVGKLMKDMLDYTEASGAVYENCRLIVMRLLGVADPIIPPPAQAQPIANRAKALAGLKEDFFRLRGRRSRGILTASHSQPARRGGSKTRPFLLP